MRTDVEKMQAILLKLSRIKNYGVKCIGIDPAEAVKTVTPEQLDFFYNRLVVRGKGNV